MKIIDHIRKRPGMYVGELSIRGLKSMLGCFFDDILKTNTTQTEIIIDFKTNDFIALKIRNIETNLFIKTLENLNAENNFVSLGLPVIIALSEQTEIKISNNGSIFSLSSKNGNYEYKKTSFPEKNEYIEIEYKIDNKIFKSTELNYEIFNQFLRKYAYINTACRIISHDNRNPILQTNLFDYPQGLSHLLDFKIGEQLYGQSFFRLDLSAKIDEYDYQVCISYQNIWLGQTKIMTYANYDELIYGGSLEKGVIDGLFLAVKQLADNKKIVIDRRKIKEQLILLAVIKGDNFDFYGSTKTKLNMPKIRKNIKSFVVEKTLEYLAKNKNIEEQILNKLEKDK